MTQPAIDEEEATPRFLLSPEPGRADAVAAVMGALRPAGMLLRVGRASFEEGEVEGLRAEAAAASVAFFVEDDVDLALDVLADGVFLGDQAVVGATRERLGDDRILGAAVGRSRHVAMTAGEQGADIVAFGDEGASPDEEIFELIQWWRSTTVLPCVAYAANAEEVARLAGAGTDFIAVSTAIWDHPDGPVSAAADLSAALEKS